MGNLIIFVITQGISYTFVLAVAHVVIFRKLNQINNAGSRQVQFIKIAFMIALLFCLASAQITVLTVPDLSLCLLINLLNAYIVFHFFNLSQTGRRIKLLMNALNDNRETPQRNDDRVYESQARLRRLLAMGQIISVDDRYKIKSRTFLRIGHLLMFFKKYLFRNV